MNPPGLRNLTPSQAALHLGVSAKALRLYEEQGLLAPGRSSGGWRLYNPADLQKAASVLSLRTLGLSLAQIARVMSGDARAMEGALAAQEERLLRQAEQIDGTLRRLRTLREDLQRGETLDAAGLDRALGRDDAIGVGFELPWPWAGEWFALGDIPPLNFITGPLGSGKTRFAQRLALELPDALFLGLDRRGDDAAVRAIDEDAALAGRVQRTTEWLVEEGAVPTEALRALVVALESESPGILVVDMVEEGLCEASQRALMACLRARPGRKRALFLMTRSSAILDLDLAGPGETVIYCPANHSTPFRASLQPGGRGYEAVATCLGDAEARARTAGITAIASGGAAQRGAR
jgi:DNA-binding transcriptional MerR regulator